LPAPSLTERYIFPSYDIAGTRTYQLLWTEITALGPAWVSDDDTPAPSKKHGREDDSVDILPSPKRGPAIKRVAPSSSSTSTSVQLSLVSSRVAKTSTKTTGKGKGKGKVEVIDNESDLSEDDNDTMSD